MKKLPWGSLILIFVTHYLVVLIATYAGRNIMAGHHGPLPLGETIVSGLTRWDSGWYIRIVEEGYNVKSVAFFPLYPMLIRGLASLGLDSRAAGLIISGLAFLLSLVVLYRLFSLDYPDEAALRALWYLAVAPTAFYFSALYTESLFLFLVATCLLLARSEKWLACGLFLMLATLTRSLGVFLILPVGYLWWKSRETGNLLCKANLLPVIKVTVPVFSGLSAYMYYLWSTFGNPLAFMTAQAFWKREAALPWSSIFRAFEKIYQGNTAWNLLFTLVFLTLLVVGIRLLPLPYLLYGFAGLIVPLCSPALHSPLLSMPRFVLVLFPAYLAMALLVKSNTVHNVVLSLSVTGLIYFNMLFALGRWVA